MRKMCNRDARERHADQGANQSPPAASGGITTWLILTVSLMALCTTPICSDDMSIDWMFAN